MSNYCVIPFYYLPLCKWQKVHAITNEALCDACNYWLPGGWFNIKMTSSHYRKSHCRDKTIVRRPYLHNRISNTGKMKSLYWIRSLFTKQMDILSFDAKQKSQMCMFKSSYRRWRHLADGLAKLLLWPLCNFRAIAQYSMLVSRIRNLESNTAWWIKALDVSLSLLSYIIFGEFLPNDRCYIYSVVPWASYQIR